MNNTNLKIPKFLRRKVGEAHKEYPDYIETETEKPSKIKRIKIGEKLDKRSPHQRTVDSANQHIQKFEGLVDQIWDEEVDFGFYDYFNLNIVGRPQVKIILEYYLPLQAEVNSIASEPDLQEAYSCYDKATIRRATDFINGLISDCEIWIKNKKQRRTVRRKRTISKTKQIAKVNYQKDAPELKLVSVDPVTIIGAKEVWVFNTKYNTLGKYVAGRSVGLEIKGSTIKGFDKDLSVKKKLRANIIEEKTQAVLTGNKPELRVVLEAIKAKESKLNGRLNNTIILLRSLN
jgi:hypothetical protein